MIHDGWVGMIGHSTRAEIHETNNKIENSSVTLSRMPES